MSGIYLPSFAEVSAVAASRGQDSAAPDQWRGLVGMWRPSAGIQGDRLIDWSGNANHGSLQNMDPATDWVSGRHGWALDFDGGNDYVDAGPGPFDIIEGTSKATLMLWCRRAVTSDYVNIGNREPGASVTDGLIINGWSDGKFYLTVSNGSPQFGSFTSNDTNWHHVVLRFDGTESTNDARLKGYLDGIQQTLTYNDTIPATISSALPNLFIGRDESVAVAYTNGLIDDGRLYSRALTASEIQSIYRDPTAVVRWAPRRRHWYMRAPVAAPAEKHFLPLLGVGA